MKAIEIAKKAYFAALKEEKAKLLAKLAEIDEALEPRKRAVHTRVSPSMNPSQKQVWNFCHEFLSDQPLASTEELLAGLKMAGMEIHGKRPESVLHWRLNQSPLFAYRRGMGWSLSNG